MVSSPTFLLKLFLLFLLLSVVLAEPVDNLNPQGAGCVDPEGFLDCYAAQLEQLVACGQVANSTCADTNTHLQTCLAGCEGAHRASKVGCWLQSCWNRIYSCEYQRTAAEYVKNMDLVQSTVHIPFYPAPDGELPGGCSCNVGNVYGNFSEGGPNYCFPVAENGSPEALAECTCCQASYAISNVLNDCQKTDLTLFGFAQNLAQTQHTIGRRTPDQCAVLDASDSAQYCANAYGIVEYTGDRVYNPLNLPPGIPGTEDLTNLPGTAFTTFTSILTLVLVPGFSSVITPVSFDKKKADQTTPADSTAKTTAAGGQGTPSSSGSGAGSSSGTGTSAGAGSGTAASGATTTSKPSGAGLSVEMNMLMACVATFAVVLCML